MTFFANSSRRRGQEEKKYIGAYLNPPSFSAGGGERRLLENKGEKSFLFPILKIFLLVKVCSRY